MSYHNPLMHNLNQLINGTNENIIASCLRQHAVLVDLLMHKELQRNGLSPHAVPFYPMIDNIDMKDLSSDSDDTNEDKEIKPPQSAINNTPKEQVKSKTEPSVTKMPAWIKEGRFFKQLNTPNSKKCKNNETKTMRKHVNRHDILNQDDMKECQNNNNAVKEIGDNVRLK